jgi:hypothetical protein
MLGWQLVPSMVTTPNYHLQLFIIPGLMIDIGIP